MMVANCLILLLIFTRFLRLDSSLAVCGGSLDRKKRSKGRGREDKERD